MSDNQQKQTKRTPSTKKASSTAVKKQKASSTKSVVAKAGRAIQKKTTPLKPKKEEPELEEGEIKQEEEENVDDPIDALVLDALSFTLPDEYDPSRPVNVLKSNFTNISFPKMKLMYPMKLPTSFTLAKPNQRYATVIINDTVSDALDRLSDRICTLAEDNAESWFGEESIDSASCFNQPVIDVREKNCIKLKLNIAEDAQYPTETNMDLEAVAAGMDLTASKVALTMYITHSESDGVHFGLTFNVRCADFTASVVHQNNH